MHFAGQLCLRRQTKQQYRGFSSVNKSPEDICIRAQQAVGLPLGYSYNTQFKLLDISAPVRRSLKMLII
ncbi:MAG: hypothetical protein ACI8PP_001799 [Candidatus Pseudothioglobus sp.]|jgi:hypothetical protein